MILVLRKWAQDSVSLGYNLFSLMEDHGAQQFRSMGDLGALPYIFTFQKGKGLLFEELSQDFDDILIHTQEVFEFFEDGKFNSPAIETVNEWDRLVWKENTNAADSTVVKVFPKLLEENEEPFFVLNESYEQPLSTLNEQGVKAIKLGYEAFDAEELSPGELEYWRVFYKGFPDAALATITQDGQLQLDTIARGEGTTFKYQIQNVSPYSIDSLDVRTSIKSRQNNIVTQEQKIKPLQPFESMELSMEISTENLSGAQEINIQVNPDQSVQELYYFNNFGTYSFFVKDDRTPPIIDVTFDGVHIMDGEIVSAKPEIFVRLIDENPNQKVDDVELFDISLKKPDGSIEKIQPDDPNLSFTAATEGNEASILYYPTLSDGLYTLIVDASDRAGNFSSDRAYEVEFNIITESKISNVLNYPNPFSTSTQFIFTLTGDKVPDNMAIQIYTASGIIVRTIDKSELGPLRVGLNRTEYTWDGTDDYGDKLANGVYFYRVKIEDEEKEFELFDTQVDQYFKNGFGKLVILR